MPICLWSAVWINRRNIPPRGARRGNATGTSAGLVVVVTVRSQGAMPPAANGHAFGWNTARTQSSSLFLNIS
jgi:hypothetical protein